MDSLVTLRDYQSLAVRQAFDAWRAGHRSVLMCLATGSGKRKIALYIMHLAAQKRRKVLFVGNRRLLINQAADDAEHCEIDYGVIMADVMQGNHGSTNQIASLQTLESRHLYDKWSNIATGDGLPEANLLVHDEAHSDTDRFWHIASFYPDAKILGLSATPVGREGRALVNSPYDVLLEPIKNSALIERGFLLPTRVWAPSEPQLDGVKIVKGEYNQTALGRRVQECTVAGDVFKEWDQHQDKATVCFVPGVPFGRSLVQQFNARYGAGTAQIIAAKTKPEERLDAIGRIAKEGHGVLVSCDVLKEGFDCLDAQTEILTAGGWVGINNIPAAGELIWTLNSDRNEAELAPVLASIRRPVRAGERFLVASNEHINLRVTEGHRLYHRVDDEWSSIAAGEAIGLSGDLTLPLASEALFEGIPLTDDEIRFVAWFMTDGGLGSGNRSSVIEIAQSKDWHHNIRDLLKRLGYNFSESVKSPSLTGYKTDKKSHRFCVPRGVRGNVVGWGRLAPYLDRDVSPLLMRMTKRQFTVFWEELMKGAGSQQAGKGGQLICSRQSQADRYMQMAVTRGMATCLLECKTRKGKAIYYVRVRDASSITLRLTDKRSARFTLEESRQEDEVWCVTTRNDTLITRRNGKVLIIGNCPVLSCGIDLQPSSQLRSYWQKLGRIKRTYEHQTAAVWLDFAGNYWRFPHPDEDPEWPTCSPQTTQEIIERKRAEGGEKQPIMCPKCWYVRAQGPSCPNCGHAAGEAIRRIRLGQGRLKEVPARQHQAQRLSDEQRLLNKWKSRLYGAMKSGLTYSQCAAVFAKETGSGPKPGWPGTYAAHAMDWSRRPKHEHTFHSLTKLFNAFQETLRD